MAYTPTTSLQRIREKLAGPRSRRQVEALLASDDPGAAIRGLGAPELFGLVKQVGLADCEELLHLASPAQVRACLDLDCWDRDRLQTEALAPWLSALTRSGFEHFTEVWRDLDSELAALVIARATRIFDHSLEEEAPEIDDPPPGITTPDTFFTVWLTSADEEMRDLVRKIIEDLYRGDMALARHTLMAARSETLSSLEDSSYRWRAARMADYGYVDYYAALEVFRPLDIGHLRSGMKPAHETRTGTEDPPIEIPPELAERIVGKSFLARALDRVAGAEAEAVETDLFYLSNRVLSALRTEPSDSEAVAWGTDYALSNLALGLELVARGDIAEAKQVLESVPLIRIHRVGYATIAKLGRFARALASRAGSVEGAVGSLLEGLSGARPLFPVALERPGSLEFRPFESVGDVQLSARTLAQLALRIALADALDINIDALAERPGITSPLDDALRTAALHAALGGEMEARPLSQQDLRRIRGELFDGAGKLIDSARQSITRSALQLIDTNEIKNGAEFAATLVADWSRDIEEAFAGLDPATEPDPRFLAGFITWSQRS